MSVVPVRVAIVSDPTLRQVDPDSWVRQMRLRFCRANNMVDEAGELRHEYFRPKTALTDLRWTSECEAALIKGMGEYGVGAWADINKHCLHGAWSEVQLRIKASKLLGKQRLDGYAGVKFTPEQITQEWQQNHDKAVAAGCWNGVVWFDNDDVTSTKLDTGAVTMTDDDKAV